MIRIHNVTKDIQPLSIYRRTFRLLLEHDLPYAIQDFMSRKRDFDLLDKLCRIYQQLSSIDTSMNPRMRVLH